MYHNFLTFNHQKMSKIFNYSCIVIGGLIAIYAQAGENQSQFLLIGGIVVLMLGLYRISRNIPSKKNEDENNQNDMSL